MRAYTTTPTDETTCDRCGELLPVWDAVRVYVNGLGEHLPDGPAYYHPLRMTGCILSYLDRHPTASMLVAYDLDELDALRAFLARLDALCAFLARLEKRERDLRSGDPYQPTAGLDELE